MKSKIDQFVEQIFETAESEISCTECLHMVSEYVEREVAGEAVTQTMPSVRQHLKQCRVCREEYQVLGELARLEAQARTPPDDDLSDYTF